MQSNYGQGANARSERFSAYYYRCVALGEGCGCAEQLLKGQSRSGLLARLVGSVVYAWRERRSRTRASDT